MFLKLEPSSQGKERFRNIILSCEIPNSTIYNFWYLSAYRFIGFPSQDYVLNNSYLYFFNNKEQKEVRNEDFP